MLKISDNCQENTSVGTSFWIKIGLNCMPQLIFIKKDTPVKIFPCKCWEKFNVWMNNFALRYSEAAVHRFFFKISFFKNFAIFTEKHMGWNLFLKKLLVWRAATWLKRGSNTGIFLWVLRIFKSSFFMEHLWWLLRTIHYEHLLFQISNQQACFMMMKFFNSRSKFIIS